VAFKKRFYDFTSFHLVAFLFLPSQQRGKETAPETGVSFFSPFDQQNIKSVGLAFTFPFGSFCHRNGSQVWNNYRKGLRPPLSECKTIDWCFVHKPILSIFLINSPQIISICSISLHSWMVWFFTRGRTVPFKAVPELLSLLRLLPKVIHLLWSLYRGYGRHRKFKFRLGISDFCFVV